MRMKRSSYIFAKKKPLHKRVSSKISEILPKKKTSTNYSFDIDSISVTQASDFIANPASRSRYAKPEPENYVRSEYSFGYEDSLNDDFVEFDMQRASAMAIDEESAIRSLDFDTAGYDFPSRTHRNSSENIISRIIGAVQNATKKTALYLSGGAIYLAILMIAALLIVNAHTVGVSVSGYSTGNATEEKSYNVLVENFKHVVSEESAILTANQAVEEE